MLALENADEILQILDRFTKQKSKDIPPELEEYINYVAKTGDTVYRWPTVQYLFREKLRNVIKDFHDTTASIEDLPQCPNVDQFNYESMKTLLFERFDNFQAAPFTIQRLCELLTDPKKHYTRLDKFMRALEKNILVVSTVEPGRKPIETDDEHFPFIHENDEISKKDRLNHQNGLTSKDHPSEETPSSSVQTTSEVTVKNDIKKDEENMKVDEVASDKLVESDTSSVKSELKKDEDVKTEEATIEKKPIESNDQTTTEKEEKEEKIVDKPDEIKSSEPIVKTENGQIEPEVKEEKKEESTITPSEEKKIDEEIKEDTTAGESVEIEKPATPKHARSTSDDEDDADRENDSNPIAKKIRLDSEEEKKPEIKIRLDSEEEKKPEIKPEIKPDSEPSDILDSISTEIDAQKEDELLEDVASVKVIEKEPINETPSTTESAVEKEPTKPTEESPATVDLLKTEEPATSIPSDLDFTPDDALNELVSSDILAVIPEQPASEEVKMSEESTNAAEPIATVDAMNVENNENSTEAAENTAMEDAPIKPDEEQMDVDESNSVDAMDL